jgi:hypothetical protein
VRVGRDDLPQDGVVEPKIFVTDAVADALDLLPWLGREIREPVVREIPDCLGD